MRMRLAFVLVLLSSAALAQSGVAVKQSGNVTPNQVPWWVSSGVIGGGVTSADSPISSFGVTNNGYNGICTNSQRITAAGRQTLCMGVTDAGGGRITLQNYGTDTAQPFQFVINGTTITPAGGITALTVGSTTIGGGTNGYFLYNNNGILGAQGRGFPGTAIYATDYGVKCDGNTLTDAVNTQTAVTAAIALGGVNVIMPAGTCPWTQEVFYNSWTSASPSPLTVPGIKIIGQGDKVTKIDTRVSSGHVISANPDWLAAHKAAYLAAVGTAGSLATNTYYLQITMTDPAGNEIQVGIPKSFAVIGATGSVSIPLPAVHTGYSYNLYFDANTTPAHYATIASGNATLVAGNQTVVISAVGSAHVSPTNKIAIWQEASVQNLSIVNSAATASASGVLLFRVGYSDLTNVNMNNLTGNGLDIPNYTGDIDGSFVVTVKGSKFDTIAGWGINAAGTSLEFSNFTVDTTSFNLNGTLPANLNTPVTISAIPNGATPSVTTSAPHNLLAGDQIAFSVTGMTLVSAWYRVGTAVASTTFNLVDTNGNAVDTTSLGAFAAGTVSLAWRPPKYDITTGTISGSGAIAYVGLISTWRNLDFTQNKNTNIYFSEAGSSDNATFEGMDFENTYGKGMYLAGLDGGAFNQGECLSATALGPTISCAQLGTGFAGGGVRNFNMAWAGSFKIRSDVAPAIGFEQFQNTNIGATFRDTVRVGPRIDWQSFDAAGQTRFSGFVSDGIPGQVQFSISAANTAKLIPLGYGGVLPLHLKSGGEWVPFQVPSAGVTGAVTGGLTPTTSYNCYAFNSAAAAFPWALGFECNATATVLNEGYKVKSGDTTRTFIGTATTDGAGNFQAAGAQTSWYPPAVAPSGAAGGDLTGTYPNPTIKASASLVTPNINVAIGTSLALGGGSIGSDALEVTGTTTHNGGITIASAPLTLSGNQSASAWTTNGVRIKGVTGTLTDTTSSGTVATAYTNVLGGNTIAASSATTFSNYYGLYTNDPVAGTNVTLSNKWAIGADSARFGTSNQMTVSTTGAVSINSLTATTVNKISFPAPATAATINISDNKTLTINNTLQLAGTDSTTQTFPTTSATIARTDAGQTFTGTQAFGAITATTVAASTSVIATSASATCLAAGLNGASSAAFVVDCSAASQAAGFRVVGAASGGTVNLLTTDSGSNNNLAFNAKGTGTITFGSVSTGNIVLTPDVSLGGQYFQPNITTTSAAQTGTVCWTTGTGKFTVDTTVGCLTSVMRAKNIIERLASAKALDIVARLDPFAFKYKNGFGDSGRYEQFGFGAEEVALVDERLVGRDPEGTLQGVRYQELTAVLAGAIKELKADNDNLRNDLAILKKAAR